MAEEVLFELLHGKVVARMCRSDATPLTPDGDPAAVGVCRLERMGFASGLRLVERMTRDWPRFKDELETVKYICKDFWLALHREQIDNLRTNHQGVYVLLDNSFRLLSTMSGGRQYQELSPRYLAFTCGLMRGALSNLGLNCVVTADVTHMPACKFHIQMQRS